MAGSRVCAVVLVLVLTGCSSALATPPPTIREPYVPPVFATDPNASVVDAIAKLQASVDALGTRLDSVESDVSGMKDLETQIGTVQKSLDRLALDSATGHPTLLDVDGHVVDVGASVGQVSTDLVSLKQRLKDVGDAVTSICSAVHTFCYIR